MPRIGLVIEYEGTDYAGWQRQPNGLSIQQVLEEALEKILAEPVRLHSSGRTDAGVHARGMVAHFDTTRSLPLRAYVAGVNALIPPSISVREAGEVAADFHARFDALGKWYRYSLFVAGVRSPLVARQSWHLRKPLDLGAMRRAGRLLVGTHDFAAFRASGCAARGTVREIFDVDLVEEGALVHLDVRGSGFLRNMVRILAGTLVEVGQGVRSVESVAALLRGGERTRAGRTAPACGLCLMAVDYPSGRLGKK